MRSIKYGTVRSNTLKIEVVLPNGSLIEAGSRTFKTSCGYNLKDLFIGSEGTLGIIVKAVLRVYPIPESSLILYAEFNSLKSLNKTLCEVLKSGIVPSAMEFSDKTALKYVFLNIFHFSLTATTHSNFLLIYTVNPAFLSL